MLNKIGLKDKIQDSMSCTNRIQTPDLHHGEAHVPLTITATLEPEAFPPHRGSDLQHYPKTAILCGAMQ